jgi:hypothetical protein
MRRDDAVRGVGTENIKVTVLKAAVALVEHVECLRLCPPSRRQLPCRASTWLLLQCRIGLPVLRRRLQVGRQHRPRRVLHSETWLPPRTKLALRCSVFVNTGLIVAIPLTLASGSRAAQVVDRALCPSYGPPGSPAGLLPPPRGARSLLNCCWKHEDQEFTQGVAQAPSQQPCGSAAWTPLRHQQDQPAFQGAAGLGSIAVPDRAEQL